MKYCRFVKNDELEHAGMSKEYYEERQYNSRKNNFAPKQKPLDMQKAYNDVIANYFTQLKTMSWDDAKAYFRRYFQAALGGTGSNEMMKSSTYQSLLEKFRLMWEKERGIRRHSWG